MRGKRQDRVEGHGDHRESRQVGGSRNKCFFSGDGVGYFNVLVNAHTLLPYMVSMPVRPSV